MSINSMIFLTAFLPVVFVLDRLCVRKTALKNILLLLASLVFYAWGDPVYIVLLLVSIAAKYGVDIYVIDCGWHDEVDGSKIHPYVGKWRESKARFPHGLKNMTDYIRACSFATLCYTRGMRFKPRHDLIL